MEGRERAIVHQTNKQMYPTPPRPAPPPPPPTPTTPPPLFPPTPTSNKIGRRSSLEGRERAIVHQTNKQMYPTPPRPAPPPPPPPPPTHPPPRLLFFPLPPLPTKSVDDLPWKDEKGSSYIRRTNIGTLPRPEALDDLPWKDEKGPSYIRRTNIGTLPRPEALDDLPWKDEKGPSSTRRTLEPFQRQRRRNVERRGCGAHMEFSDRS